MKRPILSMLLSVLLLLPGCTQAPSGSSQEEGLTVLATTYPVYLFARTVAQGVEGVTVERLNTGSVSCLHDYTLSVDDMKKIEGADVIAMNGAGLEDFMDDALAASSLSGVKAFTAGTATVVSTHSAAAYSGHFNHSAFRFAHSSSALTASSHATSRLHSPMARCCSKPVPAMKAVSMLATDTAPVQASSAFSRFRRFGSLRLIKSRRMTAPAVSSTGLRLSQP